MGHSQLTRRIQTKIRHEILTDSDRLTLHRELCKLKMLRTVVRGSGWWKNSSARSRQRRWQAPRKSKSATPGVCKCGEKTPHSTKDEWRAHWRIPHYRARLRNFTKNDNAGYKKAWRNRITNNFNRAIERRILIFKEMAPQATALMSRAELEKIVTSVRNPTTGWLWSYTQLRAFIKRTYGNAIGWKHPNTVPLEKRRAYYARRKAAGTLPSRARKGLTPNA